ncbi:MAG TPA: glycosyltransferase family 4 protein [Pyrinomonadaceae bacterium]|nr:glycosyltransferase family 4 protein [Pyrinomonadaceae bacterium]
MKTQRNVAVGIAYFMRILQIGPYAPPHGGVQANLAAIRAALMKRGIPCAVMVITRSVPNATDQDIYRPSNAFQSLWLLMRLRYGIIHLHMGGMLTMRLVFLTLFCSLMPRSKSVLTFHSGGYPRTPAGRSARARTLRGFVFRRLDRIIAVNEEIAEMFKKFGVAPARIRIISPHVITDPPHDTLLPETFSNFRQGHEPLLITVSGLEEAYDQPTQVEALGLVRERFPQAGLVIVGSGSLEQKISEVIESKSYASHILLCGDVAHAATLRMMAESDLFLRTTLYDGDSISVREAMYLGTPVIATNNATRPDGVELVPPSDPHALQQAIERRILNGGAHVSISENGEENIEAVLRLYQELAQDIAT